MNSKWRTGDEVLLWKAFENEERTGEVGFNGFTVRKNSLPLVNSCTIISPPVAVLMLNVQWKRTLKII